MTENTPAKTQSMLGAVSRLVLSLTRQSPLQALRVAYAFALQGTAPRGSRLLVSDLERDAEALEDGALKDSLLRVLVEFEPDQIVCDTTARAFDLGLARAWDNCFNVAPPSQGAWRNLRLVIASIELESLADLCRQIGISYGAAYSRQRRALLCDWSPVVEVLARLPQEIVSVVDYGEDTKQNQRSPQWLTLPQIDATGDHDGADQKNVKQSDGLGFHPQQLLPGLSEHDAQGAGFVLTPPPGGWRSK